MARGHIDATVRGGEKLRSLSADLRAAGSQGQGLRKELRKQIKIPMASMQRAVQNAIRAIPSKQRKHRLRYFMARYTKLRMRLSGSNVRVALEVDASLMPPEMRSLPRLMEYGKWRHPVFGTDKWVSQRHHEYFWVTVRPRIPEVRRAVDAALDKVARDLNEGS
jgi:hypothetical protein